MPLLLKKLRQHHQMTLEMLSEKTDLTKSYLSKVERGVSKPSIEAALKIARAMDVTVEALFDIDRQEERFAIRKATNGIAGDPQSYLSLIGGLHPKANLRAFLVRPTKTGRRAHLMSHHQGEEILYILQGSVELRIGGRCEVLHPGDCVTLDPETPHKLTSLGEGRCEVLVVVASADVSDEDVRLPTG
ncbi:XRE family transcriptional regulator [Cereibacter sp. SYSU M97828]|nr:XRE family transcriptional regulator [Cereibacter flavus]